ncbi:hypothetical protein PY310_19260 [Pseudarthrobacter sp. H3Y2-7]|uniref:hypothetical protein n=1 Tax=Pseudarthrobacter naphthalenicus TaxID=3031328 RepID=UPI0023B1D77F|nr:hypothetical protein [Pseudarthrobacter sp. H3Y2-7]MDE8670717.1 hypothetical protein [Pseudarthrobacter sp. H3Y2-7]
MLVTATGCTVVGLDTDKYSSGVVAEEAALFDTIQSGNGAGTGPTLSTNVSDGVPRLQVTNPGSSNVDLYLLPGNDGYVRFGTKTASADAPITGFVGIRDSSGVLVKLAVIA